MQQCVGCLRDSLLQRYVGKQSHICEHFPDCSSGSEASQGFSCFQHQVSRLRRLALVFCLEHSGGWKMFERKHW